MHANTRLGCLAVLALLVAACSAPSPSIPQSNPEAPGIVLDAYLNALVEGDCVTARALATPTFGDGHFCGVALHMTSFGVDPAPATPRDGELVYSTTITTQGGDETILDGTHTWFYTLIRQEGGAWRIAGGGTGP